jgi:hypothetical protein
LEWSGNYRSLALIVFIVIIGFGLRVSQAAFSSDIYDEHSYEIVADIMQRGGNVYAETSRYNYSPVWANVLLIMNRVSSVTNVPLNLSVRVFLGLVDMINAFLIALIAECVKAGTGRISLFSYLLNPIIILVVGFDGQFEILATLPLLLAVWLYLRTGRTRFVWPLVTVALITKHIVLFSCWTLLVYLYRPKRAILLMIASMAIFALSFAPFLPVGAVGIYRNVLRYTSLSGVYGLTTLLPPTIGGIIFLTVMSLLPILALNRWHMTLVEAMGLSALGFLVFVHGIGDQYFILPAIWISIYPSLLYWVYSAWAATSIPVSWNAITNLTVIGPGLVILHLNSIWLLSLAWFIRLIQRRPRRFLFMPPINRRTK